MSAFPSEYAPDTSDDGSETTNVPSGTLSVLPSSNVASRYGLTRSFPMSRGPTYEKEPLSYDEVSTFLVMDPPSLMPSTLPTS